MASNMPPAAGLAQFREKDITFAGKTYRLTPLTIADLGELEAWVATQLPDPIAVARELAKDLPPDLAKEILLEAYQDVKNGARRLGSPEAIAAINTFAGYREMLFLHGRSHQPLMTRDDWGSVIAAVLADDQSTAMHDVLSEEAGGAVPDPKAGPSSSTAAPVDLPTSSTSTSGSPSDTTGTASSSIV